jgi:signal transduction histidine kinase
LLISFITVLLVCLILVGLGLFLFVSSTPLGRQAVVLRLEEAARASISLILQQEPQDLQAIYPLLDQAAVEYEVRILALDADGRVVYDSAQNWVGRDFAINLRPRPSPRPEGVFTGPEGRTWLFVGLPLAGEGQREPRRGTLVFASPWTRWVWLMWFVDSLLPPLLRAGLIALALSILLAWLVARSVSRPLQRVAAAARGLAQGDLQQRAPVAGPEEVRSVARAFNTMASEVATSQQAQRDFVANVSHELKTPLTSIQGFSQAILDGTATDEEGVQRAARIIYEESERMRRMVEELLHLARFDAGQVEVGEDRVDLARLLGDCVERLRPQAQAAGNRLSLAVHEPASVVGDADWLAQAFTNLLDNGIRHTRDGKVEVELDREDTWAAVTVTDTGEGIPAEDLSRIFERFYQADKSRRRKGGAGLGLSITHEVVQRHGGEIAVESVVGLGSRFTVRLPADGTLEEQ